MIIEAKKNGKRVLLNVQRIGGNKRTHVKISLLHVHDAREEELVVVKWDRELALSALIKLHEKGISMNTTAIMAFTNIFNRGV